MSKVKVPWVSQSVSQSVTRSPIELFWTAKKTNPYCKTCQVFGPWGAGLTESKRMGWFSDAIASLCTFPCQSVQLVSETCFGVTSLSSFFGFGSCAKKAPPFSGSLFNLLFSVDKIWTGKSTKFLLYARFFNIFNADNFWTEGCTEVSRQIENAPRRGLAPRRQWRRAQGMQIREKLECWNHTVTELTLLVWLMGGKKCQFWLQIVCIKHRKKCPKFRMRVFHQIFR